MEAYLIRQYHSTHTYGMLITDTGQIFYSIERPWLNNQRNISCIPPGTYRTTFLPRSASGKYKNVWHIQNVPNRGGILIHNGNFVSHSKGCLILGFKKGVLGGTPAVLQSRKGMRELNKAINENEFNLTIIGDPDGISS